MPTAPVTPVRDITGEFAPTIADGKAADAFVPLPLPPTPALNLAPLQSLMEQANQAVGRHQRDIAIAGLFYRHVCAQRGGVVGANRRHAVVAFRFVAL